MKTVIKKTVTMIVAAFVLTGAMSFAPVATETGTFGTQTVYAASKSSTTKQVRSLRKSIKSYNSKTQTIAKRTASAKKYANKTKSYYKKSLKTKKISTLKSYKRKANEAYKSAQIVDYKARIKTAYNSTNTIYKSYPGTKAHYTKAKSIYDKSKKEKSISNLKSQLTQVNSQLKSAKALKAEADKVVKVRIEITTISKNAPSMKTYVTQADALVTRAKNGTKTSTIKSIHTQILTLQSSAKAHKSTLTWYEAEYRQEWVEGYYKTIIDSPAEYRYMLVGYYVGKAETKGYIGGGIFPYYEDKDDMKAWGCIYYQDENGDWQDIIPSSEMAEYERELYAQGIRSQWRETTEQFLIKPEVSHQEWVPGYYKQVFVRAAGWY